MRQARQAFASGLLLGVSLTALGVVLAQALLGPILARSLASPEEQILANVHSRLSEDFVRPVNDAALMRVGVRAMVDALDDEYSSFVGPDELRDYNEDSTGRLIGIGAQITDGGRVRYPTPGGPAERAGLRPGDTIVAVDGNDVTSLAVSELVEQIKGPARTRVHLQVRRHLDQSLFEVEIPREAVPTGTVGRIEILDPEFGIGRIHIRSFAKSTARELEVAVDQLVEQGMRALILDLRFNRGGLLESAVDCAALFVEGGVICTLHGRDAARSVRRADPDDYRDLDLPMAVLVNGYSASGAEVLAAGLRDRGAAVLVGSRSYGKGVYQQVQNYADGDFVIKFTAGYYVTPGGRIIESQLFPDYPGGLEPDLEVSDGDEVGTRTILLSLMEDAIPEQYHEQVVEIWPALEHFPTHPSDPPTETARKALLASLSSTP